MKHQTFLHYFDPLKKPYSIYDEEHQKSFFYFIKIILILSIIMFATNKKTKKCFVLFCFF